MSEKILSDSFLTDGFNLSSSKFFNGYIPLKEVTYVITLVYINGYRKEIYGIRNPYQFINAMKKNPNIKECYFKCDC